MINTNLPTIPKIGLIGHRSWIAAHLVKKLESLGFDVIFYGKDDISSSNLSNIDVLFLIAGRARPTSYDMVLEEKLCEKLAWHSRPPKKIIYLSSTAVERDEKSDYVLMKINCERTLLMGNNVYVLRAPVIYGPGQSIQSDMLIPSIMRAKLFLEPLMLKQPFKQFNITEIDWIVDALIQMAFKDSKRLVSFRGVLITPIEIASVLAPKYPVSIQLGWEYEQKTSAIEVIKYSLDKTRIWYEDQFANVLK